MSRHYSITAFFREMSPTSLARYFQRRQILQSFDFESLRGTNRASLLVAWRELPDAQRALCETDFQDIFALGSDVGAQAILDEAGWRYSAAPDEYESFVAVFSSLPNHYERAMAVFLDHADFWKGATRFYHADTLPYWRKRKGFGHRAAAVDNASLNELARLIRDYFHLVEGRGKHCIVECYRRGDRDYFFAYPEDYSRQTVEWKGDQLGARPHNPALEVVYVYSQSEGSVDLNARGAHVKADVLHGMFAAAILKLDKLPPDPKDKSVYDLGKLLQPDFAFRFAADAGITGVEAKSIRLSYFTGNGQRATLEAKNSADLYALLEKVGKGLPLDFYNVTRVELVAVVEDAEGPPKKVPIRITWPNSCSLKYDSMGQRLRAMLEASGIERRPPPATP